MTSEIVYPLGTNRGDTAYREQQHAKQVAELKELARHYLSGEPDPEPKPRDSGLISDFGYQPRPEPSNTLGFFDTVDTTNVARKRRLQREAAGRRRARQAGSPVIETISRAAIILRDKSACHICRKHVEDNDIHLDHVIPLALGGEHSADNLRVSHSYCNLSKGARLIA